MDMAAKIEAHMNANEEPESPAIMQAKLLDAAEPIVGRLTRLADEAVTKRSEIEKRWIQDLKQYHGVRDEEAKGPGSSVFVNVTRTKTNRVEGRICDLLFPPDDQNWGIQPTPVPELSTVAQRGMEEAQKAVEELNRMEQAPDADPAAMQATLDKATDLGTQGAQAQKEMTEAEKRCERMSAEIKDQLVECGYSRKSRDAIGWACKLGVGVLKGPVLSEYGRGTWEKGEDGRFALSSPQSQPKPSAECVSPWAFFPDPSASDMCEAEYVLERHLPNKLELKKLARKLGFDKQAVKDLLARDPGFGSNIDLNHLTEIRSLTGETTPVTGRYVLWEYHGALEVGEVASLIRAYGGEGAEERAAAYEEDADPLDSRMVILWFCEGKALKIAEYYPMDSQESLYSVFCLEKGGASILGAIGVPRMMRDSQAALNGAWRMMLDNAALSVGPQILVNKKSVVPEDGSWKMRPNKVWLADLDNAGAGLPFQTFNIPMNQEQLAGIINLALTFIDDETAMPRVAEGGGSTEFSPGNTPVGTMSMLMNSAGVNIRRIVKSWDDDVTSGLITRFYDWNMQHNPKEEIKGDMSVEARGTSVLLVREMQSQNLSAIASTWTTHPVLGAMVNPYQIARMALQALSLSPDGAMVSEDEYQKKMKDMAAAEGSADPQWETKLKIAEMETQAKLQVADKDHEIAIMGLASQEGLTIEQIKADLAKTKMSTDSDERKLAVEVGVEQRNKAEAEARGMTPTGSGGAISMGSEAA